MSFVSQQSEKFAQVFDKSPYQSSDPITKIQYLQKGNNVIFGRTIKDGDYRKLIYIGKVLENTVGANYLSADAWLDVTFPHVIYITGTRGSGKSFDLGVLIEGISQLSDPSPIQNEVEPTCSIVIDTQSQFWTLGYKPNPAVPENKVQLEQLSRWNIKPNQSARCRCFIPPNSKKVTGAEEVFHIKPSQVRHEEWCAFIGEQVYSPQGHVLGQTLDNVPQLAKENYTIDDMISYIEQDSMWTNVPDVSRNAVIYKLHGYRRTGLFSEQGLEIKELLKPGQCSVFMLRDLRSEDMALVTGIIARQVSAIMGEYHKKLKARAFFGGQDDIENLPSRVWIFVDEAHIIAPSDSMSAAKGALIDYVKRGRDAGLSLVMATQQPSAVEDRILSQVNISFSHRLSFQSDISAAINRVPTKLLRQLKFQGIDISDFGDMLRGLEAGECFIGDNNTSRTILTHIRPRVTSHGGYNPR
ncbi:hypothetical protein ES708_00294 [subsurface metagenome]